MCEGPKYILLVVTHVLGIYKFYSVGGLGVCHAFIFPEVVGEVMVYLIIL